MLIFIKVQTEKYIQDFFETLQKLIAIRSQFLIYELRLFTSTTCTNFETMNHFFTLFLAQTNV